MMKADIHITGLKIYVGSNGPRATENGVEGGHLTSAVSLLLLDHKEGHSNGGRTCDS
jgi:hypothetical protein